MKTILITLALCLSFTATVQAEKSVVCWRNAVTGEREQFNPHLSVEKMRDFVRPQTEENLLIYNDYIAWGFSPLDSLKGVMNYNAQQYREKARLNRKP